MNAKKLSYREKLTEKLIFFLYELKNGVSFLGASINELIYEAHDFEITQACRENMKKGKDFPIAFKDAVLKTNLKKEEKELLSSFSESFGSFDRENSILSIDYYIEKLKSYYEKAKEEREQKSKLIISLSASIGLVFVIFAL